MKSVLQAQYYSSLICTAQKCNLILQLFGKTEYWQDYRDVTMLFSIPINEISKKNKKKTKQPISYTKLSEAEVVHASNID